MVVLLSVCNMVRQLDTPEAFQSALNNDGKLVAVDFTATWCGPCKMIGPRFAAMATEFPLIDFVKVDAYAHSPNGAWLLRHA